MKIIREGNLTPWFRTSIWIFGLVIAIASYFFLTGKLMFWGMMGGIVIASIGAYAEKANALKLKPFDSTFKQARDSYDREKDQSSGS